VDVTGKRVVVVGAARTGVEAARLLTSGGANVVLSDAAVPAEIASVKQRLSGLEIEYELGGHKSESFTRADLVIVSPGVPGDIAPIRAAAEAGVPVLSELEFASRFCTSHILAVTGTNGKTTTTTLLYRMMKEAGITVLLAGNNEFPFSSAVMVKPAPEIAWKASARRSAYS
jgi:UDP-N-acetylmuramoylalanine--D-glutamate ligase